MRDVLKIEALLSQYHDYNSYLTIFKEILTVFKPYDTMVFN